MLEPHRALKVFLCHASMDKPRVRELYFFLKSQGVQPWFDEEDLIGGQDWQFEISQALAACDAVIICLTRNAVDREGYVQKEIKFALDRALEIPEGRTFLIPVRFEECQVPPSLSRYQWVDLLDKTGYDRLMKALKLRAAQLQLEIMPLSVHDNHADGLKPIETESSSFQSPSTSISRVASFPAPGRKAEGIAWDGAHVWLTDNSASIFKVDTSGATRDVYQSPEGTPQGITWDGSGFWVYTTNRSLIYHLQMSGGQRKILGSFPAPTEVIGGGVTQDLAWDGTSLWYANQYKVYRLEPSGRVVSYLPFSKNITGVAWDGSNLWLACREAENVTLMVVDRNGKTLATYPSPVYEIDGLAWGDGTLWALGIDSPAKPAMIYKLQINYP